MSEAHPVGCVWGGGVRGRNLSEVPGMAGGVGLCVGEIVVCRPGCVSHVCVRVCLETIYPNMLY